ncbi:hypothetical protein J6590_102294 [Homalodisca vitripennis]|nr:hypothetical protein J6590_102294 [Homalodisca vitripennis]
MYNANQLSITATPEAGAPRGTPRRPRLTATLVFVPSFVPAKRGVTSTMIVHREEVRTGFHIARAVRASSQSAAARLSGVSAAAAAARAQQVPPLRSAEPSARSGHQAFGPLEGSPVTWSLGPAAARGPFRVTMRAPQWTLMKPTEYVTTMKMISLSRQTKRPKRRFTVRGNKGAGGNRLLGGEAAT